MTTREETFYLDTNLFTRPLTLSVVWKGRLWAAYDRVGLSWIGSLRFALHLFSMAGEKEREMKSTFLDKSKLSHGQLWSFDLRRCLRRFFLFPLPVRENLSTNHNDHVRFWVHYSPSKVIIFKAYLYVHSTNWSEKKGEKSSYRKTVSLLISDSWEPSRKVPKE